MPDIILFQKSLMVNWIGQYFVENIKCRYTQSGMADQHAMFQQAVQFKRDFITNITGT